MFRFFVLLCFVLLFFLLVYSPSFSTFCTGGKADVYSFGLILWEMLSLKRPFEGLNRKEFVQSVIKGGRRPPLQQDWSGPLRELLARCWDEDMDQRPSKNLGEFIPLPLVCYR